MGAAPGVFLSLLPFRQNLYFCYLIQCWERSKRQEADNWGPGSYASGIYTVINCTERYTPEFAVVDRPHTTIKLLSCKIGCSSIYSLFDSAQPLLRT